MKRADRIFFALFFAVPAFADPQPSTQIAAAPSADVATLLALQRSGRYASPHPQTLPGDAQTRLWLRYLDSFAHPIPVTYIDHAFKEK